MGRPLFSESYSAPAVRSQPEPAPPSIPYEKWTHWNSFDPDSDVFFNREDAVYEAFLDPSDIASLRAREAEERSRAEPVIETIARERSESPASSEGTISGRGSPMAVGSDDPATLIANAYDYRSHLFRSGVLEVDTEIRDAITTSTQFSPVSDYHDLPNTFDHTFDHNFDQTYDPDQHARVTHVVYTGQNAQSVRVHVSITPVPATNVPASNVGSISSPSALSVTRPVTPPLNHDLVYEQTSPSPVPIVTPRLYSWTSHSPFPPHSPTPSLLERRTGPLTNPNARMSLAHLSPAPVRVRMA
jgi:hypothetical protein